MNKSEIVITNTAGMASASLDVSVRDELPSDACWIEALHHTCFGPGRFARSAFRIRERYGVDHTLCLVAELTGRPVANVKMSPISIAGLNGYLLGPLVTDPDTRNRGVGKLLVRTVVDRAFENNACVFVLLVGNPSYYGPLGFEPVSPNRIRFPGPVDPARVLLSTREAGMAARLKGVMTGWK